MRNKIKRSFRYLAVTAIAISVLTVTVFAASVTLKDLYWALDTTQTPPTWTTIESIAKGEVPSAQDEIALKKYYKVVEIYNAFKTEGAYNRGVAQLESNVKYNPTYDRIEPIVDNQTGQKNFQKAVDRFNKELNTGIVSGYTSESLSFRFRLPDSRVIQPLITVIQTAFGYIIQILHTIFVGAFILNTIADACYYIAPITRSFLSSYNGNQGSSMSGYGQNAMQAFKLGKLPLCTDEVIKLVEGNYSGSGGYGGSTKTNTGIIGRALTYLEYIANRSLGFFLSALYILITTTNIFDSAIAKAAGYIGQYAAIWLG